MYCLFFQQLYDDEDDDEDDDDVLDVNQVFGITTILNMTERVVKI